MCRREEVLVNLCSCTCRETLLLQLIICLISLSPFLTKTKQKRIAMEKKANLDVKNTLVYILQGCLKINVSHDVSASTPNQVEYYFFTAVEKKKGWKSHILSQLFAKGDNYYIWIIFTHEILEVSALLPSVNCKIPTWTLLLINDEDFNL